MIVDDRLDTVLRTVAAGAAGAQIQFRQLADLLGRTAPDQWSTAHDTALARLDSLHGTLGDGPVALLLAQGALRSPRLVAHFAGKGPQAALAAIKHARLDEAAWLALIPTLPVQARGFLRHRRDLPAAVDALLDQLGIEDFALPGPAATGVQAAAPESRPGEPLPDHAPEPAAPLPFPARPRRPEPVAEPEGKEGIGAIVRRIEAFRRTREAQPGTGPANGGGSVGAPVQGQSRLPFADEPATARPRPTALDIRIDAQGVIVAADPAFAAMLVGHRPFTRASDAPATCDPATLHKARARLPIEAGLVTLEGAPAISGPWQIDAAPAFASDSGHFLGYDARLRRPDPAQAEAAPAPAADDGSDRLRQLLHELRTPINAIQGFAELIQQQLFGPTPHQYRSLAASIAADAARMLAGFDDVERLVRLEAAEAAGADPAPGSAAESAVDGAGVDGAHGAGADLAAVLAGLIPRLDPVTGPREVKLRLSAPDDPVIVRLPAPVLERLLWRLLSVLAAAAAPGERLTLAVSAGADAARLLLTLPATLALRDDAVLFSPDGGRGGGPIGPAMLGSGFALRLAAAEARAAGGTIQRQGARLLVGLPLLTGARAAPSPDAMTGGRAG